VLGRHRRGLQNLLPVDPSRRLPAAALLLKGVIRLLPGQWEPFLHPVAAGLQGAAQDQGSFGAGGDGREPLLPLPCQLQALAATQALSPVGLPSGDRHWWGLSEGDIRSPAHHAVEHQGKQYLHFAVHAHGDPSTRAIAYDLQKRETSTLVRNAVPSACCLPSPGLKLMYVPGVTCP